jgi:integrase
LRQCEAARLQEVAQGSQLEALLTLALATGLRRGDLLDPNWRDLDLEQGGLWVALSMDRVSRPGLIQVHDRAEPTQKLRCYPLQW